MRLKMARRGRRRRQHQRATTGEPRRATDNNGRPRRDEIDIFETKPANRPKSGLFVSRILDKILRLSGPQNSEPRSWALGWARKPCGTTAEL